MYTFRHELTKIADLCKKHNVLCLSDEVYEWMVYDNNEHIRICKNSLPILLLSCFAIFFLMLYRHPSGYVGTNHYHWISWQNILGYRMEDRMGLWTSKSFSQFANGAPEFGVHKCNTNSSNKLKITIFQWSRKLIAR